MRMRRHSARQATASVNSAGKTRRNARKRGERRSRREEGDFTGALASSV